MPSIGDWLRYNKEGSGDSHLEDQPRSWGGITSCVHLMVPVLSCSIPGAHPLPWPLPSPGPHSSLDTSLPALISQPHAPPPIPLCAMARAPSSSPRSGEGNFCLKLVLPISPSQKDQCCRIPLR